MLVMLRVLGFLCITACLIGVCAPQFYAALHGTEGFSAGQRESEVVPTSAAISDTEVTPANLAAETSLIGGLDTLLSHHDQLVGGMHETLQGELARADSALRKIQQDNRMALRNANRQIRLPGRSVQILLILLPGLTTDHLSCYQPQAEPSPGFERWAAAGACSQLRFIDQTAGHASWMSLIEGEIESSGARGQSLVGLMWHGGYQTRFVGDTTVLPKDPAALGFDHWAAFDVVSGSTGTETWSLTIDGQPTTVGNPRGESHTTAIQESLLERWLVEILRGLLEGTKSRPTFAVACLPASQAELTTLDRIPAALDEMLRHYRLTSSTVVLLAGMPDGEAAVKTSAPLIVRGPQVAPRAPTDQDALTWGDVAATVAEWAELSPRRLRMSGRSRVSDWRGK